MFLSSVALLAYLKEVKKYWNDLRRYWVLRNQYLEMGLNIVFRRPWASEFLFFLK